MLTARFPWDKTVLIVIGFVIGDAINHALQGYIHSPLSPHHLNIGVTGNWLAAAGEVVAICLLVLLYRYLQRRRAATLHEL